MAAAEPPRDPGASTLRTRRALDRLHLIASGLLQSGVIVMGPGGTYIINQTIQQILDGSLDDFDERLDDLEAAGELTIEERLSRCENALRFLGVEPNEFPTENEFPPE